MLHLVAFRSMFSTYESSPAKKLDQRTLLGLFCNVYLLLHGNVFVCKPKKHGEITQLKTNKVMLFRSIKVTIAIVIHCNSQLFDFSGIY